MEQNDKEIIRVVFFLALFAAANFIWQVIWQKPPISIKLWTDNTCGPASLYCLLYTWRVLLTGTLAFVGALIAAGVAWWNVQRQIKFQENRENDIEKEALDLIRSNADRIFREILPIHIHLEQISEVQIKNPDAEYKFVVTQLLSIYERADFLQMRDLADACRSVVAVTVKAHIDNFRNRFASLVSSPQNVDEEGMVEVGSRFNLNWHYYLSDNVGRLILDLSKISPFANARRSQLGPFLQERIFMTEKIIEQNCKHRQEFLRLTAK